MGEEKKKCRDCACCLSCSKDRCRLCRKGPVKEKECSLGRSFTFGAYLEWKERQVNGKKIDLDLSGCTDCESCLSLCPSVFKKNEQTGLIEVNDQGHCPEEDIQTAMCMCPADCIQWQEK